MRVRAGLLGLTILLAAVILLPGCQDQAEQGELPTVAVTVEEVKKSGLEYTLQSTGIVTPWKEARLSFKAPGRIIEGPAEEGAGVADGAILSRLDDSDYRVQEDLARYQLELAQVELEQAREDLERYEQLFAGNAIAQKNLDDARFNLRAAEARAGQGETMLKQAGLMVGHCVLRAPFPGTVLKKVAEQGEMVDVGIPVLVLGQLDPVKVKVTVPSGQLDNWAEGTAVGVAPGAVPGLKAGGAEKREAVVHRVSPAAEGATGSFLVELKVANPEHDLRPGQVVSVESRVKAGDGLWIPVKSVVSRGEELKYVFILEPGGDTVAQQAVKLGRIVDDRIQVVDGLEVGASLVVLMPGDLKHGDRVEVRR